MIPSFVETQFEHQQMVSDQIVNAINDLNEVGQERVSRWRLEARISALNDDWYEFSGNHKALLFTISELTEDLRVEVKNKPYFVSNCFAITRSAFLDAFEKMTALLDAFHDSSGTFVSSGNVLSTQPVLPMSHRLPRLELPKFDGSLTEWLPFKDVFSSMVINNQSLTPVERLYYLKNCLTGSASLLLKHTSLVGDNFQSSWNDLISYYDNKRILIDSVLHALFSINAMQSESASELEQVLTTVQQSIRSLEMLEQPVEYWDTVLIYLVTRRLDPITLRAWELELGSGIEYPKWKQLCDFIIRRIRSLQAIDRASTSGTNNKMQPKSNAQASRERPLKSHFIQSSDFSSVKRECPVCGSDHYAYSCPEYSSKPTDRKIEIIRQKKLCFNCIGSHLAASCPSPRRCLKCGKKHHTSIHSSQPISLARNNNSDPCSSQNSHHSDKEVQNKQVNHLSLSSPPTRQSILLATARAKIELHNGEIADVRILIDQGSEISLVTERFVQLHHIPRKKSYLSITGAGAHSAGRSKGSVCLKLKSNLDSNFSCSVNAEFLPQLTTNIPSVKTPVTSWTHIKGIDLADPDFSDPDVIDIILGADLYHLIIQDGLRKGKENEPIAQLTRLGWIISGPVNHIHSSNIAQGYHCSVDRDWHDLIEKFCRQEEVVDRKPSLSPSELECENHFQATHSRTESGKYVVRLPFKVSTSKLGDSKVVALKCLNRLFHRFNSDHQFFQDYQSFLKEYRDLGHMKEVPLDTLEPDFAYYIPHQGVRPQPGSEKKLRVVFNGSSKTTNGTSLNEILHTGAKLQLDLFDVLLWFRKYRYVFSTDIEKMYRQILVHPDDWCLQRILWRNDLGNIVKYELNTVTYGLACAPFLALRTLNQLIEDEGAKFPLSIPVLTKGRYVDDLFGGGDSIPEVQPVVHQVN